MSSRTARILKYEAGDKLIRKKSVNNNTLYANTYADFDIEFVKKHFKKI